MFMLNMSTYAARISLKWNAQGPKMFPPRPICNWFLCVYAITLKHFDILYLLIWQIGANYFWGVIVWSKFKLKTQAQGKPLEIAFFCKNPVKYTFHTCSSIKGMATKFEPKSFNFADFLKIFTNFTKVINLESNYLKNICQVVN